MQGSLFYFLVLYNLPPAHNITTNAIRADEQISSAFYQCATFVLWLDVINIILLSIFISRLLINIVAGADTATNAPTAFLRERYAQL